MKILVYGWYNQGNLGDELFKEAFHNLFPQYEFIFTDKITLAAINSITNVFIGGGSFLFSPINMEPGVLEVLKTKNIFYIGVGAETELHLMHKELLPLAKLIAIRSHEKYDLIKSYNVNVITIPDIVYSLNNNFLSKRLKRSILILPNISVVPNNNDPYWKHTAWNYFKSEFSQFLDFLLDQKYSIKFLAMCQNKIIDDNYAAIEIINCMKNKNTDLLLNLHLKNSKPILSTISNYDFVISQRFHGIVLAEMTKTPYISLHHHDKLKRNNYSNGKYISYFEMSKDKLFLEMNNILSTEYNPILIESNIFDSLKEKVNNIVNG